MEFSLPRQWKKELLIQGFYYETQWLNELFGLCEILETSKEILQTQGEVQQHNKKTKHSVERRQYDKSGHIKGSYLATKPLEEDANKKL